MSARFCLDAMLPLLRHLSGDAWVGLRVGPRTAYLPGPHVVEVAEEAGSWSYLEQLALIAHEATHVRLSHYDQQMAEAARPFEHLFNWFEDARVHRFLLRHVPAIADGVWGLEHRVVADPVAPRSRATSFLLGLRAQIMGVRRAWPIEDREVGEAIEACRDAAEIAVRALPGRDDYRNETTWACSAILTRQVEEGILPVYEALLDGEEAPRPPVARSWVAWRERGAGASAPTTTWDEAHAEVAEAITGLVGALRRVLPPNDASGWTMGHRSGPRLALRSAMRAQVDPGHLLRAFERQEEATEGRYRLGLALDTSGSMKGAPLHHLGRSAVLLLEAAERLGLPTSVVAFGVRDEGCTLLKDLVEPLAACRGRLDRALLSRPRYGDETPLAAALDRMRLLHVPEDDVTDLLIVVTDGRPCRMVDRTYVPLSDAARARQGRARRRRGWLPVWQRDYDADCRHALDRLEAAGRVVVGLGIGERAEVGSLFPHHLTVSDARALPCLLGDLLRQLLREPGGVRWARVGARAAGGLADLP